MARRIQAPVVRTMENHEANPLYLRLCGLRTSGLHLAADLARSGLQDAANELKAAIDRIPRDLPGLSRKRAPRQT